MPSTRSQHATVAEPDPLPTPLGQNTHREPAAGPAAASEASVASENYFTGAGNGNGSVGSNVSGNGQAFARDAALNGRQSALPAAHSPGQPSTSSSSRSSSGTSASTAAPATAAPAATAVAASWGPRDVGADIALLHRILDAPSWQALRDVLLQHQEAHAEACRLAATAAAAAVIASDSAASEAAGGSASGSSNASTYSSPPAFTPRLLSTALHAASRLVADPRGLSAGERLALGDFVRGLGRACAALPAPSRSSSSPAWASPACATLTAAAESQAAAGAQGGGSGAVTGAWAPADLTMALRALARLLGGLGADAAAGPGRGRVLGDGEEGAYYDEGDEEEEADGEGEDEVGAGFVGRSPGSRGWAGSQSYDEHDAYGAAAEHGYGDALELSYYGGGGGGGSRLLPSSQSPPSLSPQSASQGQPQGQSQPQPQAASRYSERGLQAGWLDGEWLERLLGPAVEARLQVRKGRAGNEAGYVRVCVCVRVWQGAYGGAHVSGLPPLRAWSGMTSCTRAWQGRVPRSYTALTRTVPPLPAPMSPHTHRSLRAATCRACCGPWPPWVCGRGPSCWAPCAAAPHSCAATSTTRRAAPTTKRRRMRSRRRRRWRQRCRSGWL